MWPLTSPRVYYFCARSRYQDILVEGIAQLRDRCHFDGVYLDGTQMPIGCANERHGCGYRTADGELRSTYPIFAVRRLMQRLYAAIHLEGGLSGERLALAEGRLSVALPPVRMRLVWLE